MKNQNNKDLNSGINSTTFNRNENAYKNRKEEALASKNIQNHDINSKNNVKNDQMGMNPFAKLNSFNRRQGLQKQEEGNVQEQNSNAQEQTGNALNNQSQDKKQGFNPLSSLLNKGKDKNNIEGKLAKIKKTLLKIKIVLMISGPVILVTGFAFFICVLFMYADIILDKGLDFAEGAVNFLTLNGYRTTTQMIKTNIDKAAGECSDCILAGGINSYKGLDKELLYATVNNQVLIGPEVYEADEELVDSGGEPDLTKDFFMDKIKVRSFYNMKADMLGSKTDPGTMIYSLIGLTMDVKCTEKDSGLNNAIEIAKYVGASLVKIGAVMVDDAFEVGKLTIPIVREAQITKIISTSISYGVSGANYFETQLRELGFTLKSMDLSVIGKLITETAKCEADGKYAVYDTHKTNDYSRYYGYIEFVYVPTVYNSIWYTLDDNEKKRLVKETWADIVNVRNANYQAQGINNYLYYNFDEDGDVVTGVSVSGSGGSIYVSDIPVGTEGTSWKQFVGPWADKVLSSGTFIGSDGKEHPRTMHYKGCYITSIAILMANSGTTILKDTFDPGVLAQTLIDNKCINVNGDNASVICLKWSDLAPNFKQVGGSISLRGKSKSDIASIVSSYLSQGKYVMLNVKSGGHFVAVVGIEGGRVVIADPGVSKTPTYLDESRYPEGTITNMRVFEA